MSPDTLALKVRVFTYDFKFWIGSIEYYICTLLLFFAKTLKDYRFCWVVSLWCELFRTVSISSFKSDQWIEIWRAKFELECVLLLLVFFSDLLQFKIQSHLQKRRLRMPVHQDSLQRKQRQTFLILQSP